MDSRSSSILFGVTICFFVLMANASPRQWQKGDQIRMNLPPDRARMTLYSEPGFDYYRCQFAPADCANLDKSWPSNDAKVEFILGPDDRPQIKDMKIENYFGEVEERKYLKVKVEYKNESSWPNSKVVWIEEKYIASANENDGFRSIREELRRRQKSSEVCDDKKTPKPLSNKESKGLGLLRDQVTNQADQQIAEIAKLISPAVGKCSFKHPIETAAKEWNLNKIIYDQAVLPNLSTDKIDQNAIAKKLGKNITLDEVINIDSLARTIYSEMARCYGDGLHYPLAVAKVVANRVSYFEDKRATPKKQPDPFRINDRRHLTDKPILARVVTAPQQFSVWNPKKPGGALNKSGLSQALCPPSGNTYWKTNRSGKPARTPDFEKDIWEKTLKIATEAVLFPETFTNRTRDVKELYYTSGLDNFYGLPQVTRWIDNKPISNGECMNLFSGKPSDTAGRRRTSSAQ